MGISYVNDEAKELLSSMEEVARETGAATIACIFDGVNESAALVGRRADGSVAFSRHFVLEAAHWFEGTR